MAWRFRSTSVFIIIGAFCNCVVAWQYCVKTISSTSNNLQYCEYGCCNEYTSSPCCAVNAGLIVGAVIASLVGLALLIGGICILIHCSKANTRRTAGVAPQIVTTNVQYMQPMVYQPYYQAATVVYPPPPPPRYIPPAAEPLPPPIYVERTRPPVDHQGQ